MNTTQNVQNVEPLETLILLLYLWTLLIINSFDQQKNIHSQGNHKL